MAPIPRHRRGGHLGLLLRVAQLVVGGRLRGQVCRMTCCAPERGLRGVTSVLRSKPLRPGQVTVSPSFPVWGMSFIFMRLFLSLVVVVKRRAWSRNGKPLRTNETARAKKAVEG